MKRLILITDHYPYTRGELPFVQPELAVTCQHFEVSVICKSPAEKQEYPLPRGDLLLIDDVCTTGATLQRAYQLLRPHSNTIEAVVLCAHPLLLAHREENRLQWFQRRGRSWKER